MFIKISTKNNILKLTTMPVLLLASFLSILFSFQLSTSTYAATYLNLSISKANIDFQFNQVENAASAFKEDFAVMQYDTDNIAGFTTYVSSIDEDTNLNHVDSSVTQKIASIASPSNASSFNPKNWGYLVNESIYSGTFRPISKASQPEQALNLSYGGVSKFFLHFGVKTGSDLPAGTYSKKLLITAITNHAPTTATLKVGADFVSTIGSLNGLSGIKEFKHSVTAPAAGVSTKIASIPSSEMPVYLWYDTASKTVFWWSDADTVYANEDSSSMFEGLGDVEKIDLNGINTSRVKNMSGMFFSAKNLYKEINLANFDTSNVEDMSRMFGTYGMKTMENLVPIDFSRFNTSKVKNMEGMFLNSFLPSLDIKNFDTSNVKNMARMFDGLKNVRNLDLSDWNVKKVNNIQTIFTRSNNLQSLNLSGWQMDSVTSMYSMFSGLTNLTSLNLTGFTTKNVTNMKMMFGDVRKLADLDLSSFDTSKVTTMSYMFGNMESLNNINLSSFNTSNVTDMSGLFMMGNIMNPQISRLDLSNFDTSNVTNMNRMFYGLSNLTELKIQSFNTKKVKNMSAMFARSFMNSANGILDISSFDTRNVTEMSNMFIFSKLKTIYTSPSFVTTAITVPLLSPNNPFMNNTNLVGGNGTHYVHPNNSGQYAHIDAPGNPGYFTQKP
ncbi:BspA family leucine-rich repeat surface protein [TM7 phylum sp. oral taxon 351]|nr:BspA family leucine-rich repeat surface protein [TM7 phylum sp. oral taxon 351]